MTILSYKAGHGYNLNLNTHESHSTCNKCSGWEEKRARMLRACFVQTTTELKYRGDMTVIK